MERNIRKIRWGKMSWKREGEADSREDVLIVVILGCVSVSTMLGYAAVTNYPLNISSSHGKV